MKKSILRRTLSSLDTFLHMQKHSRRLEYTMLLLLVLTLSPALHAATEKRESFAQLPIIPDTEMIQIIRGDLSYGSNTPITINRSGVYRLAGPLSATSGTALTISANNVSLDLDGNTISGGATGIAVTGNNVSIKNGTVQNASDAGISISGSKGAYENVQVINTSTGFLLQNAGSNLLANCRSINCTSMGFSLVGSYTNTIRRCQALGTTGSASGIGGFISEGGSENTFDSCITQATKGLANNSYTCGIMLTAGERKSTITNCHIVDTTGPQNAYGIFLRPSDPQDPLKLITTKSTTQNTGALSVDWLNKDNNYLAVGSATKSALDQPALATVFNFSGSTLDQVATTSLLYDTVHAVAWRSNPTPHYLATGGIGFTSTPQNKLDVSEFTGSTLDYLASVASLNMTPLALDWFDGTNYLAAGGINPDEIRVYNFNGSTLDLIASVTTPGWNQALSVACLTDGGKKYIAAGGASGTTPNPNTVINIYEFTGSSIDRLAGITAPALDQIWSVAWLADGGTNYLAAGGLSDSQTFNKEVNVYQFTGSTLDLIASPIATYNTWITSVAWFIVGSSKYIVLGESLGKDENKTELIRIYRLNGTTLTLAAQYTSGTHGQALTVATLRDGFMQYLASGNTTGDYPNSNQTVKVFQLGFGSTSNCMVKNSSVTGTTNNTSSGEGIHANSSQNYVAANTATDNDINYQAVASQYITSQANARGVYNIDTSLTTPDMVNTLTPDTSAILETQWSIESKAEAISSKIDPLQPTLTTDFWSIESKVELTTSSLDTIYAAASKTEVLAACDATPLQSGGTTPSNKTAITGDVTLSTSGCYCLSTNLGNGSTGASLTITGNNITVDLNRYTIDCNNTKATGVTIIGNNNTLRNGVIKNATSQGISLTGNRCTLENLDVVNSPTGYYLSASTRNTINNCRALDCTQIGFLLSGCQQNTLSSCQVMRLGGNTAASTQVTGFYASGGQANTFDSCKVNGTILGYTGAITTAQGMRLTNEDYDTITQCTIDAISTANTTSQLYGMRAPLTQTQLLEYPFSYNAYAVSWLESKGNRYIAWGRKDNPYLSILRYTGTQIVHVGNSDQIIGANAYAVDWLQSTTSDALYLAAGCSSYLTDPELRVYQFIEPNTFVSSYIASYNTAGSVYSVDWLTSCTSGSTHYYLASGGAAAPQINICEFTGTSATLTVRAAKNTAAPADAYSVNWLTVGNHSYLAVGEADGRLELFEFTGNNLVLVASRQTNSAIATLQWLTTNTNTIYLALGHWVASGVLPSGYYNPQVEVYLFDPTAITLTPQASYTYSTAQNQCVFSLSWLPGIDNLNYLAIGGTVSDQAAQVLRFDGSCLTPLYGYTVSANTLVLSLDWLTTGSTLLVLGCDNNESPVRTIGFSPTRNTITNNTITNIRGGAGAIAYAVEANNLLTNNTAYNNDANYLYTPEYGDSNYGFAEGQGF